MRNPARAAAIGALAAALCTLPGLGNGTLWDNSETAYGEVAREIVLTHDWIVMHLNGRPWFVQPPLYFWIGAIFIKVFGLGSLSLRLPSALATIAMSAMTGYAVAKQAGTRAGVYAGVILSTAMMQAIVGRLAIMDAMLDLAVALSIFWWFRAVETGRGRYAAYGWIAAGLGFLTKGPVAPVIALLVMVPYALWEWRAGGAARQSRAGWLGGFAIFLAIVLPWFGALVARTGLHSVVMLIGHYTFGRYTGTIENQSGPIWYYVPVVILGLFPWIAFVPSSIAYGIGALGRGAREPAARIARLAFAWMVLPFLFFSFANTKLPNYVALELPAFAVLTALYFDDAVARLRSRSLAVATAAVPVALALVGVAVVWFSRDNQLSSSLHDLTNAIAGVVASVFAAAILALVAVLYDRTRSAVPYVLAAGMTAAFCIIAYVALPETDALKPIPHLAAYIDAHQRPGDSVAIGAVSGKNGLIFYTAPPVADFSRGAVCASHRVWAVMPLAGKAKMPAYGRHLRLAARWNADGLYLYSGRCYLR